MTKFVAACLALTALLTFLSVGCGFVAAPNAEKHTGPVTVRNSFDNYLELIRANGELFEMRFMPNGLQPKIQKGDVLADVVYVDLKDHWEFFVKATLLKEHAELPPADKILYDGQYRGYACSSNGDCTMNQVNPKAFYLWSDGGYRNKPEPKR